MKTRIILLIFVLSAAFLNGCVEDPVFVGPPTITEVATTPSAPGATDNVTVSARITDLKGVTSVKLNYKVATAATYTPLEMTAGSNYVYTAVIPPQPLSTVIVYYIEATNVSDLSSVYPDNAPATTSAYTVGAPAIVINEIFSRGVPADPDWIELYNSSNSAVDLSGYKIYDSGGNSGTKPKMTLPAGTSIPAHGYYVIVVDISTSTDPSGFGLSSAGEEVWLESSAGYVIDDVVFPAMPVPTSSYGRKPDGSTNWEILTNATKNAPNSATPPAITNLVISPLAPKSTDAVTVSAGVTDAVGVSVVKLYYKADAGTYTSVAMTAAGGVYSATIPAQAAGSVVSYYVEASNTLGLMSYLPSTAPATPATYTVATPPSITGLAITPPTPGASDAVIVSATVTDPGGITSVKLSYKVGAGSYTDVAMTAAGNVYSATIPAQVATTVVSYYVEATSAIALVAYAPATAPGTPATYTVSSLSSITNLAISPSTPSSSDITTVSATITDIQGISSALLYYKVDAGSFSSHSMTAAGDVYSATIPAQATGSVVSYYIEVTNVSSLKTYAPSGAPATPATYTVAEPPSLSNFSHLPSAPGAIDRVTVSITVDGLITGGTVILYYQIGTGSFTELAMSASGNVYSAVIPARAPGEVISYYVEAKNSETLKSVMPAGAPTSLSSYTVGASVILMNEIFARGTTGDLDWIEIYNASNSPVDISNFKIYDSGGNAGTKAKMAFVQGTVIAAKGYYVITVDDPATANPTGSNFGLSSGGEQVWFENADGAVIETFTFATTANATESYGRLPDGSANWQVLTTITKGTANQ